MFCSFTIIRPWFKVFTGAASVMCCAVALHSITILYLLRLYSELLRSPEVDIREDVLQLHDYSSLLQSIHWRCISDVLCSGVALNISKKLPTLVNPCVWELKLPLSLK
jgi:hypothetical protein